jgi:hypothetical protein
VPVITAVITMTAGCTDGSSGAHGKRTAGAEAANPTSTQQRERLAVAYAERLSGNAPQVAGETPLTDVPPKLAHPDQTIGVSNLITRARYWSVARSPQSLYAALKKAPVAHLRLSGWGRPGAGSNAANYGDLFYTATELPAYLNAAELYVEILGVGHGRSDIAAFAEVVPYPLRTADEIIPTGAAKVVVTRTRTASPTGPPLRRVTLSSNQARRFVAAFNAAPIRPPGACMGGLPPPFGYGATITARGVTWRIRWGGNCNALTVQRQGKPLAEIDTTPTLLHLLRVGLLGSDGSVDGGFWQVRGGALLPLDGVVTLSAHGHVIARMATERQGAFEFIVPPGHYTLAGRSPDFENGTVTCKGQRPVVVRARHSAQVDVRCRPA